MEIAHEEHEWKKMGQVELNNFKGSRTTQCHPCVFCKGGACRNFFEHRKDRTSLESAVLSPDCAPAQSCLQGVGTGKASVTASLCFPQHMLRVLCIKHKGRFIPETFTCQLSASYFLQQIPLLKISSFLCLIAGLCCCVCTVQKLTFSTP